MCSIVYDEVSVAARVSIKLLTQRDELVRSSLLSPSPGVIEIAFCVPDTDSRYANADAAADAAAVAAAADVRPDDDADGDGDKAKDDARHAAAFYSMMMSMSSS